MPAPIYNWETIDTADWGKYPDVVIAERLSVDPSVIAYWREKFGIPSHAEYVKAERERWFAQGLHWCSRCEQYLPLDFFNKSRSGPLGLKSWCKQCRKEYRRENKEKIRAQQKRHYEQNRGRVNRRNKEWRDRNKEYISEYMRDRHSSLKREAVALGGGCCQRCGYAEFNAGLSFHHVNPEDKEIAPSTVIGSGNSEAMREELDKCVLLCRNCHQSLHAGDWNAAFVKRVGMGWTIRFRS